jgi:hypothetical protein
MRTRIIHHQDTLASVPLLKKNAHVEIEDLAFQPRPLKKGLSKKNETYTRSVKSVT